MDRTVGGPTPIPLVARCLAPPWAGVLRRARQTDAHWQWPESLSALANVLRGEGPAEARPDAAVAAADRAARAAWARGQALGYRLALESAPGYPPGLSAAEAWLLWLIGAPDALAEPRVAIVGSREATAHGLAVAERLAHDLAARGVVIVSGLARGVDSAAHRGALSAGRTVAVFGSGLDQVYPRAHSDLAQRISQKGALVSEFAPGTPPRRPHFPQRNRVIAALSVAVVVVEAGERSGSLSTARWALDLGRDVLVVPSHVLHGKNRGGHGLIRDGAQLVEDAEQVMASLPADVVGALPPEHATGAPVGSDSATALENCLQDGEVIDVETLTGKTRWSVDRVLRELSLLELEGRVCRIGPGRFVCLYRK